MPTKVLGQVTLTDCRLGRQEGKTSLRTEASSPWYQAGGQGCQNVFKQQADDDQYMLVGNFGTRTKGTSS